MKIKIGQKYKFAYPKEFVTLPEYSEHRNQIVTVIRELEEGKEYDLVNNDHMFEIKAKDGWIGVAWETELQNVQ